MSSISKISPTLQPVFRHKISRPIDLDVFNAVEGMAVSFDTINSEQPQVDIKGCGGGDLTSTWYTESRTGFLTLPKSFTDVFTIRFIMEGSFVSRKKFGEHKGKAGYALLTPFEGMVNDEASPSFKCVSGTVTRKALIESYAALYGSGNSFPTFETVADMRQPTIQMLFHTFRTINNRLRREVLSIDMLLPLLDEIAGYQLLSAWPQSTIRPRVSKPSSRLVGLAIEFIEANLARQFKLADVASATNISVRSLQSAFRQTTGKTPIEYIIDRRLDQIASDLRQQRSEDSIQLVAARWGFNHMGDFARRYRMRFGETPRETRQRSKRILF